MAGTFWKWLVPGLVTVIGGSAIALTTTGASLTTDLSSRTGDALGPNAEWARVRLDGQDAVLSGTTATRAAADEAIANIASVPGIRSVDSRVVLLESVSPFPFSASIDGSGLSLSGGYPSEAIHKELLAAAGTATDHTRLLGGAPDSNKFTSAATFALGALKQLDHGYVQLADLSLSISGSAKSSEAFDLLESLKNQVPAGITLAALTVTPPVASPYIWHASFDGARLTIDGNVPSPDVSEKLRSVVPPTIPVDLHLEASSGEPQGFNDNTLMLLKSLLALQSGEASISDKTITLSGAPGTQEIADRVTADVTAIGGTASLEPPQVGDYALSITKTDTALTFAGFAPDKTTRDKLASLPAADVANLKLARGAPEHFAEGLKFALDALSHLSAGQADLKGARLSIGGHAASRDDYKALMALLAAPPAGVEVVAGELRAPAVSPFVWSATKADGGAIATAGYVPDDTARAALKAKITTLSADTAETADGAPDDFARSAGKGLEILALLDTGTLSFDGKNWSIEGTVDSLKKGFAADAAYSIAGLRTAGWTYTVHEPTLPQVNPYVWRAQKAADGGLGISGYEPDTAFQESLKTAAPQAADSTTLAAGAPADFATSALAGLEALGTLKDGTVGLNGAQWSLTGTAADPATRDAVQARLFAAVDKANWQVAIDTAEAAPVVAPYLWSATKTADGTVALAGYLPSSALKADAATRVGKIGSDSTSIAAGAPEGFADDLKAGLAALAHLSDGRAMFDGNKWSLTGDAAAQDDGAAAVAALAQGTEGGKLWTVTINGYTAPSAAEAPTAPSSSAAISASDIVSVAPLTPPSSVPEPPSSSSSSEASSSSPASSSSLKSSTSVPPESSSASESSSSTPPSSSSSTPVPPLDIPSSSSSSEEPAPSSSVEPPLPMPTTLRFEATRAESGKIALSGSVPSKAAATSLSKTAGGAATKALAIATDLPDTFVADASSGLAALAQLPEGHLGFDGTHWWLQGRADLASARDGIIATIGALPDGGQWAVSLDLMQPLDACRSRILALQNKNVIQFTGRDTFVKTAQPALDALAADLAICPNTDVHVQGHTDNEGAASANLGVSVARAEAVIAALVQRGADEGRFYAEGFGEADPIASNDTKPGKAANRRITFQIDPR